MEQEAGRGRIISGDRQVKGSPVKLTATRSLFESGELFGGDSDLDGISPVGGDGWQTLFGGADN
jgi:hypothetical protein